MTGTPEATRPNATGDIASMYDDGVAMKKETEMTDAPNFAELIQQIKTHMALNLDDRMKVRLIKALRLAQRAEAAEAAVAEAREVIEPLGDITRLLVWDERLAARAWLLAHPPTRPTT